MPSVVFVHRGNPFYLKYAVAQARETQPDARLYLLGDETNRWIEPECWHPLELYGGRATRFESRYVHLSPNDRQFELFCIQRWLYLAEFVERESVQGPVACIDSDSLIYSSLNDRFAGQDFDLALTRQIGPAFTLFRDPGIVAGLAGFIESAYSTPDVLTTLKKIYNEGISPFWLKNRYVSDMHLLGLYGRTIRKTVDLAEPWDGHVFDYAFGLDEGYAYNPYKRIKRIWRDRNGFYSERGARKFYFSGLHFQVGAKVFLPQYYTAGRKFADRHYYAYVKWRGRATTAAKWLLHKAGLHRP